MNCDIKIRPASFTVFDWSNYGLVSLQGSLPTRLSRPIVMTATTQVAKFGMDWRELRSAQLAMDIIGRLSDAKPRQENNPLFEFATDIARDQSLTPGVFVAPTINVGAASISIEADHYAFCDTGFRIDVRTSAHLQRALKLEWEDMQRLGTAFAERLPVSFNIEAAAIRLPEEDLRLLTAAICAGAFSEKSDD